MANDNITSWEMSITSPDGATTTNYHSDPLLGAVPLVTNFSLLVRGDGACIEGTFNGKASALQIPPRAIVSFRVTPLNGITLNIFRGVATKTPMLDNDDLHEYRLVGLHERLDEQVVGRNSVSTRVTPGLYNAQDVATMAAEIIDDYIWQIVGIDPTLDIPAPLGFELSTRITNYETLAESLDALADSVPELLVSTTDYVYNGVTYTNGDLVPAATWGVRADGTLFFKRVEGFIDIDETALNTRVEWLEIDTEEIVTKTILVFEVSNDEDIKIQDRYYDTNANIVTVTPGQYPTKPYYKTFLTETYEDDEHPTYRATKVIPFSVMASGFLSVVTKPSTSTPTNQIPDHAKATDGDPTTYGYNPAPTYRHHGIWFVSSGISTDSSPPIGVRVVHSDEAAQYEFEESISLSLYVQLGNLFGDKATVLKYKRELTGDSHNQAVTSDFYFTPSAQQLAYERYVFNLEVEMFDTTIPADLLRIYEVSILFPELSRLKDVGKHYIRKPATHPAKITVYKQFIPTAPVVNLTKRDGSVVSVPAKSFEYIMDKEDGLRTIITVDQDLDADMSAQRSLLNKKSDKALQKSQRLKE